MVMVTIVGLASLILDGETTAKSALRATLAPAERFALLGHSPSSAGPLSAAAPRTLDSSFVVLTLDTPKEKHP